MIRHILVFGIGGVGGYFGGMLAKNTADRRISFIARGAHLEAIREKGLLLDTDNEKGLVCRPHGVYAHPEEAPIPDLCIVTVKGYDLDEAGALLNRYVKDHTVVLPLLNGVDIRERLRKHITGGLILPSCVYVSGNITAPGRVVQRGPAGSIIAGKDPDHPNRGIEEVEAVFSEAGIPFTVQDDPSPAIWQKFLFIAAYGLVSARSRKNFGELLADPALTGMIGDIITEAASVARAAGVALSPEAEQTAMDTGRKFPPETRTSFQRDVEAGKAKNEGDLFGGTLIRLGKSLGVPTPVTERVFSEIRA
ncbi:MAG: 2-dehydropantoate 2-reductase [Spirochaetales bacterium]|nr:2-dehydropantoate 2-reductase [Spirochaetales bacterium]